MLFRMIPYGLVMQIIPVFCDGADLLALGVDYGGIGIPRVLQDNGWYAHAAVNWGITRDTLDFAYSDCNGDGIIDANDTLAINLNFSYSHPLTIPISDSSYTPDLYFQTVDTTYSPGDWVDVDIMAGKEFAPVINFLRYSI